VNDNNKLIIIRASKQASRHGNGAANIITNNYGEVFFYGQGKFNNNYLLCVYDYSGRPLPVHIIQANINQMLADIGDRDRALSLLDSAFNKLIANHKDMLSVVTQLRGYASDDLLV
jgi:hypothetical protein